MKRRENGLYFNERSQIMSKQNKDELKKVFGPDFLTPQERLDRIVEILTRGVLKLIAKKGQTQQDETTSHGNSEDSVGKESEKNE